MNRLKISLLTMACVLCSASVFAENSPCQDYISMQLQEEGWVTSKAAEVSVSIQAVTSKNNVSTLMDGITNKLTALVKPVAAWRLVDLSVQKNNAGLFSIAAQMTARLDNDQLAQLQSHLDSLNKAGEQYKIEGVNYQPTMAEIALENTHLRELLYHDALEQQKLMNLSLPGTHYELQSLNFDPSYTTSSRPMVMFAGGISTGSARQSAGSDAMPFSQHLVVTANMTFASPNLDCQKMAK